MIKDSIRNYSTYPIFTKDIISFIEDTNPQTSEGKYDLGNGVFAIVQKYTTKTSNEGHLESHQKYIDIQYIVSGQETIEVAPIKNLNIKEAYDTNKDICFYEDAKNHDILNMVEDTFAVLYPDDAHKPCIDLNGRHNVVKIVIKVPFE